jgi:uncharacterized protein YqgV (UPF0045/DUF77 family)
LAFKDLRKSKNIRNLYGMANQTTETADTLDEVAVKIEDIAKQFAEVAQTMRHRGVESIEMNGMTTLHAATLKRLLGVLFSAQRALADAKPSAIEAKAREANRKADARRKQKKD